jgi:hypothetical protein
MHPEDDTSTCRELRMLLDFDRQRRLRWGGGSDGDDTPGSCQSRCDEQQASACQGHVNPLARYARARELSHNGSSLSRGVAAREARNMMPLRLVAQQSLRPSPPDTYQRGELTGVLRGIDGDRRNVVTADDSTDCRAERTSGTGCGRSHELVALTAVAGVHGGAVDLDTTACTGCAGHGRVEATVPMVFSGDETTDVGRDTGTGVSSDWATGNNSFTGRIHWVQIDIDDKAEDLDHLITPQERLRIAMARQ